MFYPKRQRYIICLINYIVIITFLWSNLVWAGGVEWYKLSAPSQVTAIVPVADALATGQDAIKKLVDAGIDTKEEFCKRSDGVLKDLPTVQALVFSDKDDPSRLAYYVFTYSEPYFSRITTHREVNDSLWSFLGLNRINERAFSDGREFAINGKKYYQRVYALDEKDRGFIDILVNRVFDEKPVWALCGIGYSKEELNGVFRGLKARITVDKNGVNIVNEKSPYIAYKSPARFVMSIIDNNGGVHITSGLRDLLLKNAPYLLNAILKYRKTGLDDKVYDLQGNYLSEEVFLLYGEGGEPLGDRVLGFIEAVAESKFGVSSGTDKYSVLSRIIQDVKKGRKNSDSDTLNDLLGGDKERNKLNRKDISLLSETLEEAEGGRYGDIVILPSNAEIFVIGDTHGDSESTERLIGEFKERIKENKDTYMVFLGDYVNNGLDSIDNLILVLKLKEDYLENVILLNGNHEFRETYMTVLNEFFKTHWDNAMDTQDEFPYKKPEEMMHYGHIRLELITKFGVEEGEKIYRLFEEWGRSLPYLCLSKSGIMMSHSIGLLKGQGDVTLEDLALGKKGDEENIKELGYEAWRKAQATMHSAMVNNRKIDGRLLGYFERLGIKYFVVGHTHYRSGDTDHPNAPEINDKLVTVCSSEMHSPTAGHYMYQEMVVESNARKPNGEEGARYKEKRKEHASPCWVKFEGNNVKPIVVEIKREFKKSNDEQGGGGNGDIVYSHNIDERWEVWEFSGDRIDAHVDFYFGEEKIGEGQIDIDPLAASINTCWFKSFKEGQHLGLEMAGRMYIRAYEISRFLGLGTKYAHAYFTRSQMEEMQGDYRSAEGWKKYWKKKGIEYSLFRKLGLKEQKLEGKYHLRGYYDERYYDHIAPLEDVVAMVNKNWEDWFYKDRVTAVYEEDRWERIKGTIELDKVQEELQRRINLSRWDLFSQILNIQLESNIIFTNASDIRNKGALVFDVDGTLLKGKSDTLENNPNVRDLLIDLLRKGFIICIISGNSRMEQNRRIFEPIYKKLVETDEVNLLKNLVMYVNGGGTKIEFDESGKEILDSSFNARYTIPQEDISIIRSGLKHCLVQQLGLTEEEKKKWREWSSNRADFPGMRFTLDWMNGRQFEVPVIDSEDIFEMMKEPTRENVVMSPWIETRDGVQLSIKLLPKEPRDVRDIVIREIERRLDAVGLKGKYVFRKAGFASIDISLARVDKTTALRDLIERRKIQNRWTIYFGNEFYPGGNDEPVKNIPGVNIVLVDKEPQRILPDVKGRVIEQIPGSEGIWESMERILQGLERERDCPGSLVINRSFTKEDLERSLFRIGFTTEELKYLIIPVQNITGLIDELRLPIVINKDIDKPVECLGDLILVNPIRIELPDGITLENYQSYLEGLFYVEIIGHYLKKLNIREAYSLLLEYMRTNPNILDGTIRVLQAQHNRDEAWLDTLWRLELELISNGVINPIDTVFREIVEVFLGVSSIVVDQRVGNTQEAVDRAVRALIAIAVRLNGFLGDDKSFTSITQEEFNKLFGITQIVAAGGLGTRYDPTGSVHKALGGLKEMMERLKNPELTDKIDQGEPNIRMAISGTYKSPDTVSAIVIEERILLEVLNENILQKSGISPSDTIQTKVGKLKRFMCEEFPYIVVNEKIQHLCIIPEDWLDKERKMRFLTRDGVVLYAGYSYGHGDVLIEAMNILQAKRFLDKTPYKILVFSEMAEAVMQDKTNAGFITYLEALANPDSIITVGAREGDPQKEDLIKKGHLFLKKGRLIAYTDYGYIPEVRKEELGMVLEKLKNWDSLDEEEKQDIMDRFLVTKEGNLLISANCGVFKNDVLNYSREFLTLDEKGNKVGYKRDPNEPIYTVDSKINRPDYLAWDLVEFITRGISPEQQWPIRYVNVGNAPASIKDVKRQVQFYDALQGFLRQTIRQMAPSLVLMDDVKIKVYLGENADRPLKGLIRAWLDLHSKEEIEKMQEINIKVPENYFHLLKIYNGDKERLLDSVRKSSRHFGISPYDVVCGLFTEEGINELCKKVEGNIRLKKKIVSVGGGSGILGVIHALKDKYSINSVQANIDDGGSSYSIVRGLERAGFGVIPAPGDIMNSLFKGWAGYDKLHRLMDDQGRIEVDREGRIVVIDDSGKQINTVNTLEELIIYILSHIQGEDSIPKGPGFTYFASALLNLARLVDEKYFRTIIIPRNDASIRNLVLIGVLDYLGVLSNEKKRDIGEPTIDNDELARPYNLAIDLIAYISEIVNAGVYLSHYVPGRVYSVYSEYCVFIEGNMFKIRLDKEYSEVITEKEEYRLTVQNPQIEFLLAGDLRVTVRRNLEGRISLKINDSHWIELVETPNAPHDDYVVERGLFRWISEDGTGRLSYDPNRKEFLPLDLDSIKVYIRGRYIARQTNITETANYSKIVEFGLAQRKTDNRFVPISKENKLPMNPALSTVFKDPDTEAIVVGPGSFFTSILPHFFVEGFSDLLIKARCPRILVMNSNVDNEILGYTITELLEFVEKVSGYKIDQLFDAVIIARFDYQKLEEYTGKELTPRECIEVLIESPSLIQRLGLNWTRYVIDNFINQHNIKFSSSFNYYGSALDLDRKFRVVEDGGDLGRLTVAEYLEFKYMELKSTLYQQVSPEIRTDPGSPSIEAKKSRGPLLYTREEINRLRDKYLSVYFDYDQSIAGVQYGPTRSRKIEHIRPYVRHIPHLLGRVIEKNINLSSVIKTLQEWYKDKKPSLEGYYNKILKTIEDNKAQGILYSPGDIWYICEQTILKESIDRYSLYLAYLVLLKTTNFEELSEYLKVEESNLYKELSKWFLAIDFQLSSPGIQTTLLTTIERFFQIPIGRMDMAYKSICAEKTYTVEGYAKEWNIDVKTAEEELENISSLENEKEGGRYPGIEKVKCLYGDTGKTYFIYRRFYPRRYKDAFRRYDLRAIIDPELTREELKKGKAVYEQEFSDKAVYYLALSYVQLLRVKYEGEGNPTDNLTIVVGMDVRKSSEDIKRIFIKGLLDSGINVIDIGIVPTPIVYFASLYYTGSLNNGTDGAVMITASHNPPSNNGFKPVLGSKKGPYNAEREDIEDWFERFCTISSTRFQKKDRGRLQEANREELLTAYKEMVKANLTIGPSQWQGWTREFGIRGAIERVKEENKKHRPLEGLRLLIDPMYGTTCVVAKEVFTELGAEVSTIHYELDGLFPGLSPDPVEPKNLKEAYKELLRVNADVGIAFDNDGDRIGAVYQKDGKDEYLQGDQILGVILPPLLREFPGGKIVYDVKCSDMIPELIKSNGGIPLEWLTGHANIKKKMRETDSIFGGEQSGHIYCGWFGENGFFDDSIQAAVLFLGEIARDEGRVKGVMEKLPEYYFTRDIRIRPMVSFDNVSKAVREYFKGYRFSEIDGCKIYFTRGNREIGWGLIRFSGTEGLISSRVDASNQKDQDYIMKEIYGFLKAKGFIESYHELTKLEEWGKEIAVHIEENPYSVALFLKRVPIDKTNLLIDIDTGLDKKDTMYLARLLMSGARLSLCTERVFKDVKDLFIRLENQLKVLKKEYLMEELELYTQGGVERFVFSRGEFVMDNSYKSGEGELPRKAMLFRALEGKRVVIFIGDGVAEGRNTLIAQEVLRRSNLIVISTDKETERLPRGVVGYNKGVTVLLKQISNWFGKVLIEEKFEINPDLFKMDIRGIADTQLHNELIEKIGKAFGTFLKRRISKQGLKIVIGSDNRESSPRLLSSFVRGVTQTGIDVIDIGLVPISTLFYRLGKLDVNGGVMVTGGHLEKEYNGLKLFIGENPLSSEEIEQIREIAELASFEKGEGSYSKEDLNSRFYDYIKQRFCNEIGSETPLTGYKIVVDCSNGPSAVIVPKLLKDLGANVVKLNTNLYPESPAHSPDLSNPENYTDLCNLVKLEHANLGIIFSGDGGAMAIVDNDGNIVTGDNLILILLKGLLESKVKTSFVSGSAISSSVIEYLIKTENECILSHRAYREIREKILKLKKEVKGYLLGGDISGHILLSPQYLSCGILTMFHLFKSIIKDSRGIGHIISDFRNYVQSEEVRLRIVEYKPGELKEIQDRIIEKLGDAFEKKGYRLEILDGIRISFDDNGWVLIRPSVTLPEFGVNAEAQSIKDLKKILADVIDILKVCPELSIEPLKEYIEHELYDELPKSIYADYKIPKQEATMIISVSLMDTVNIANNLTGEETEESIKGLISRLSELKDVDSWHIRRLALKALERIHRLRPDLFSKRDIYEQRIIFEDEDIRRDYEEIQRMVSQDDVFIKKVFGRDVSPKDISRIRIQYYDRGAIKQIYRVHFYLKDRTEQVIAITPIRINPKNLVFDGLTKEDIEVSLRNWNLLSSLAPDLVPKIYYSGMKTIDEEVSVDVGKPFGILGLRESTIYITREFITGLTLEEILKGNFTEEEKHLARIEAIKTYLTSWLATLDPDGEGIVINDPKPSNIILSRDNGRFRGRLFDLDYMSSVAFGDAIGKLLLYKDYSIGEIIIAIHKLVADAGDAQRDRILDCIKEELKESLGTSPSLRNTLLSEVKKILTVDLLQLEELIYVFDIDGVLSKRNSPMDDEIAMLLYRLLAMGQRLRIITGKSKEELQEIGSLNHLIELLKKSGRKDLLEGIVVYTSDGAGKFRITREGEFAVDSDYTYRYLLKDQEVSVIEEVLDEVCKNLDSEYRLSEQGVNPYMRNFGNLKFNFSPYGRDKEQYDRRRYPERKDRKHIADEVVNRLKQRGITGIRYEISGATTIGLIRESVSKENAINDILKEGDILYFGDEVSSGNDMMVAKMAGSDKRIKVISLDPSVDTYQMGVIWWGGKVIGTKAILRRIIGNISRFRYGPDIVSIGGGNGPMRLAIGMADYTTNMNNVITVFDNGGSTGVLREDLDIPAVGDMRNRIFALLNLVPGGEVLKEVFDYRFPEDKTQDELLGELKNIITITEEKLGLRISEGVKLTLQEIIDYYIERFSNMPLAGMCVGNIILVSEYFRCGKDLSKPIRNILNLLELDEYMRIMPVSESNLDIVARLTDGTIIYGEYQIAHRENPDTRIEEIFFTERGEKVEVPPPEPGPEVLENIRNADAIVIGPGSLYTSYLPNLMVKGVKEAMRESKVTKILVINLLEYNEREGVWETKDYKASDIVNEVLKVLKEPGAINTDYIQYVLVNTHGAKEGYIPVDVENIRSMGVEVIVSDLEDENFPGYHDPKKLGETIMEIIQLNKQDGFIIRGEPEVLLKELEKQKDTITDLRPEINRKDIATRLRKLLRQKKSRIGDRKTRREIKKAISDLETFDIKEFNAILIGRFMPKSKRKWLLGLNSLAPPMVEYLGKLFHRPTLGYAREALDDLKGDVLLEYLFHEALCRYVGHYEARRIQEILFEETNYKDAKGIPGRKGGILEEVLGRLLDEVDYTGDIESEAEKAVEYFMQNRLGGTSYIYFLELLKDKKIRSRKVMEFLVKIIKENKIDLVIWFRESKVQMETRDRIRKLAVECLMQGGDFSAMPYLDEVFTYYMQGMVDQGVPLFIIRGLGKFKDPSVVSKLKKFLNLCGKTLDFETEEDSKIAKLMEYEEFQVAAVQSLAEICTDEAFSVLIDFLDRNIDYGGEEIIDKRDVVISTILSLTWYIGKILLYGRFSPAVLSKAGLSIVSSVLDSIYNGLERVPKNARVKEKIVEILGKNKVEKAKDILVKALAEKFHSLLSLYAALAILEIDPNIKLDDYDFSILPLAEHIGLAKYSKDLVKVLRNTKRLEKGEMSDIEVYRFATYLDRKQKDIEKGSRVEEYLGLLKQLQEKLADVSRGKGDSKDAGEEGLIARGKPEVLYEGFGETVTDKKLNLRPAKEGDIQGIININTRVGMNRGKKFIRDRITGNKGKTIVAVDNKGGVVGYITYKEPGSLTASDITVAGTSVDKITYLSMMAVDPDCQGQGIGTMMIKEIFQRAFDSGAERVALHVRETNDKAIRLYEKIGKTVIPIVYKGIKGEFRDTGVKKHEYHFDLTSLRTGKHGPIAKKTVDNLYAELWEVDIKDMKLQGGKILPTGKGHRKLGKIGIGLLKTVLNKMVSEYGQGILAVVDAIRVVDNIQPSAKLSPYAMMLKEDGRNILLLDVDAFSNEELLYIVLEHELKESIMGIVPCENDAIRELTTNYMSLKLALEKGIKIAHSPLPLPTGERSKERGRIDRAELEALGADLQFFEALEILQAMADVTDEQILAVAIEHMRGMPYYSELFKQFPFAGEWQDRIKDAENRYKAALQVFNEIIEAKEMASKVKETKDMAERKIKGLSQSIKKVRMLVSNKPVWEIGLVDGLVKNNKYIMLDKDELDKPENKYIMDWINRITEGRERSPFIFSDEEIPDGVNPEDIIYLIEPERVNEKLPQNRLYLPLPYSVSSIYLASQVVLAGGKVAGITDKLSLNTIKTLYKTLLGREITEVELEQLFRMPWTVLPPIVQISATLETLRKTIMQIEVAA